MLSHSRRRPRSDQNREIESRDHNAIALFFTQSRKFPERFGLSAGYFRRAL
jgi:hypothetical protein